MTDINIVQMPMPAPNPPETETYLGDGLYASFDGYQIQLRAPRPEGDHVVYLEPAVQVAFVKFIERIVEGRK
ncbi:hypothetical protein ACVSQB_33025 [Bradyrhizobium elkanii]